VRPSILLARLTRGRGITLGVEEKRADWRKYVGRCPKAPDFQARLKRFTCVCGYRNLMELNMNDLIVYAGVGLLLIGLPVLVARFRAQKH